MTGEDVQRSRWAQVRAVARLARRTARREWRRTTLVGVLVAVPVMVGIVVAGIVRANDLTDEERIASRYGTAELQVSFYPGEEPAEDAALAGGVPASDPLWPEGTEVVDGVVRETAGPAEVLRVRTADGLIGPGGYGNITDLDLTSPLAQGRLALTKGTRPQAVDEVALSAPLLADLEVGIGDTFEWQDETATVVGTVVDPTNVRAPVMVAHPTRLDALADLDTSPYDDRLHVSEPTWFVGQLDQPQQFAQDVEAAVAATSPVDLQTRDQGLQGEQAMMVEDQVGPTQAVPATPPSLHVRTRAQELAMTSFERTGLDRVMTPQVVATLVAAVLLAEVALIAGAAYATGARRRLRELGLLGANGATTGHVRGAVVGEATVTGIVGAGVGVVSGLLALGLGRPVLQRFVTPQITRLELSVTDLIGPAIVAVVAVSVAAWLPARTAARVPTTTALEGRMPLSTPKRWIVPAGVVLAGFGALLLLVGILAAGTFGGLVAGLGVLFAIGGTAMLTVPLVAGVGRFADRFPATLRLVLRDSARQRTRAAAASASAMVVLIAPVLIATMSTTMEQQGMVRGLPEPDTHVYVSPVEQRLAGMSDLPEPVHDGEAASRSGDLRGQAVATVRNELDDPAQAAVTILDERARVPPAPGFTAVSDVNVPNDVPAEMRPGSEEMFWGNWFDDPSTHVAMATPDLLDTLDDDVATALETGGAVVLGLQARDTTVQIGETDVSATEVPASVLRHGFPRVLVTQAVADDLGLDVAGVADLLVSDTPIDEQTRRALYTTVNTVDITVGNGPGNAQTVRWAAVGATLVIALVILALVTMLAATESDHDLRTMVAVGAAPRMRRRFLGLQAGLHALVGAALAVPLAIALAYAAARAETYVPRGTFGAVPPGSMWLDWTTSAVVLVGVPAVISVVIAVLVRSAPTVPPRRLG